MNPDIFRDYDIRGHAAEDLTEDVAHGIGRSFGAHVRRRGGTTVALGRDCRTSSPALAAAVAAGLRASGADVLELGMVPTPVVYFTAFTQPVDAAVQITGSHHPPEYNGIKMMLERDALSGEAIQELRRALESGALATGAGRTTTLSDAVESYVTWIAGRARLGSRRPKVVVDGGNGAGGPTALRLLGRLGVDVVPMHCEPDGRFPNRPPDPTAPDAVAELRERVVAEGADFGFGLDGDADRLGVVDERGRLWAGDELLVVLARGLLEHDPGATIVADVKCSQTLFDDIAAHGGRPLMWKVGHGHIKARMKEVGASLAGELSGHVYYRHRYFGFDDAIYTASRLVEMMSHAAQPLSSRLRGVPKAFATPEIRIDARSDAVKRAVASAVAQSYEADPPPGVRELVTIDGVRVVFEDGWGLVRAGHTQAALSVRAEGVTPARRDAIRDDLLARVQAALERVQSG